MFFTGDFIVFGFLGALVWSFQKKDDEDFYTISRTFSAIGVSTQDGQLQEKNTTEKSNALQNAIDFVDSLKVFDPVLPEGQDDLALQLISENETIDRIKNFLDHLLMNKFPFYIHHCLKYHLKHKTYKVYYHWYHSNHLLLIYISYYQKHL